MTEWLKQKEEPAVNKRTQEEKTPKKAEPNFEEGVELRENALNVEVLRVAPQRNQSGVYLCKSEREANELMQRFGGYECDIPLFVAILGKVQTATLRAAAMAYGIEPKEFSFPITKHSSNDDQHQHREGWVWKVAGKIELAMSTAPPKAAWQPDYPTRTSSSRFSIVHIDIQKAKKLLGEVKGDRGKRKEAGKTIDLVKETAKSLLARIIAVMAQAAPEKLLELAVNSVTMYEGKESGARQIKIDFTTAGKTAEKLRKASGGEGMMFITCGYDEERRREDRKNERWIPLAKQADGSEPTRQQVLEEARKLTENNGIQLMHDGITFKIRVPTGKEEEGWRHMLSKLPPPGINFVADGLPGSIPNQVIEQVMKETLDRDVKNARVIVRNKGKEASKRAFLKCTGRPAADTIEVGGKMVVLRAQAEKDKDVDQQQEGFFAELKTEEAARAVLKEKEPTQSMKDFAFRELSVEKQGPVWNSLQDDDEEMEEESEAGSGSFKEHKETPLQIALAKSLEQKLKTELATERHRHAEK